jgi:hypothetical protein
MAAGSTYTPIATYTVTGSSTSTYTFSSIPSTYTDLRVIASVKNTGGGSMQMQFNSDTASNYSQTLLIGDGSSATSTRASSNTQIEFSWYDTSSTNYGVYIADLMNYANTTTYKTILTRMGLASSNTIANVALWRKSPIAAITSITLKLNSFNFAADTTFTLYGIAAA